MVDVALVHSIEPPRFAPAQPFDFETIELTCSLRETHDRTAEVTDFPIEDNSTISDHRYLKAPTLSMDGIVSEASTTSSAELDDNGNVRRRPVEAQGSSQEAYQRLLALFEQSVTFDVYTSLKVYTQMQFTKLTVTRDRNTDSVVAFSADLRRIETVSSAIARVSTPDKPKAGGEKKLGKKEPKHAEVPAERESTLHALGLGHAFKAPK